MSAAFIPGEHKAGKWVMFNLANPDEVRLLVVERNAVKIAIVEDKEQIARFFSKAKQVQGDGRLVGIFIKGTNLRVPGSSIINRDDNGEPILVDGNPVYTTTPERFVKIPDSIAPQRAIEVNGHRNLEWTDDSSGQTVVHTMLIPCEFCADMELMLTRDDIPAAHNATLDPDFDPALSRRRR